MESITPTWSSTTTTTSSMTTPTSSTAETPTFGSRTREFLNSLHLSSSYEVKLDMYQNLDSVKQKRMPDLLIDQSPMENKRVWIGGKHYGTFIDRLFPIA